MRGVFKTLTDEDLKRIYDKYVHGNLRVVCSQNHIHGFQCADFNDEKTMTIERLRAEVLLLRDKLKKIGEISKQ